MEKTNLENLNKLSKLLGADRIMTTDDVQQILLGIMEILKSYKEGTESINQETKQVVNTLLEKVIESNKQTLGQAEVVLDGRLSELEALLRDVKQMITDVEILASNVKDGKDADEEKIVEDVVGRIKIDPTIITLSAEEVRDKLASLKDDARLDKSSIKGLDKILTQKDIDYAIATLQQQTSFLINKGGVKSIVAGTNITVDNTDPSNPVVSSTGGGSPGGSTTQLQYNNAGAFGGISGATTDGTAVTYTSNSLIGADINASSSAGFVIHNNTGSDVALFGAGSGTGATFYGGVNIASNLTVDTNTLFVDATNNVVGIGTTSPLTQTGNKLQVGDNSAANQYLVFQTNNSFERGIQYYLQDGTTLRGFLKWDGNEDLLYKGDEHWWSTGGVSNHMVLNDTGLGLRTSAPTHTLTLASTSTGIALYNTADQVANFERGYVQWSSNIFQIGTTQGGTGTSRVFRVGQGSVPVIDFNTAGSPKIQYNAGSSGGTGATVFHNFISTSTASSGTPGLFSISPTINQSTSAGYTALLVNAVETAVGSGSKLLADFQVGGSSKFSVANTGIATHTNTVDAASNQVLVLQGDRATPAANDEIYQSFLLSSSTGVQREMGRITVRGTTVTNGSEISRMIFSVMDGGTLAQEVLLTASTFCPVSTDGNALGTTGNQWADLFLASGGVINWNNGNYTLTHSADTLTANKDLRITTVGTDSTSVPTLGSTSTLTNKTISGASNTLSNISFGSMTFLGCRVTQSAGQSITASTLTALAFDTESYDTDTMHDNVTNNTRVTFTTAGRYAICGAVTTDANAVIYGGVRLNGTTYIAKGGVGNAGANTGNGVNLSFDYNFSAGDYIELMGTFGTTQNTKSGVDGCFITASRIG